MARVITGDDVIEDDTDVDMGEDTEVEPDDDDTDVEPGKAEQDDDDDAQLGAAGVRALQAEREEKKALRRELRELKRQLGQSPKDEPDPAKPVDPDRLRLQVESETVATWKPMVVRSAASSALVAAGLIGSPDRLLKLLDMDDIDVDPSSGKIDGVDDAVADLKRDYPHLFRRKAGSRQLDAGDRRPPRRTEKMSDSQIQAAQLRGEL